MKRVILTVSLLFVCAGGLFGLEFPTEEIWSCNLPGQSVILGDPWTEANGDVCCLLGFGDHVAIIRTGGIVWESPQLSGVISAGAHINFGLDDGPRVLVGVIADSSAKIIEFIGRELDQQIEHYPANLRFERQGEEGAGSMFDNRQIRFIIPGNNQVPDSSRTVLLAIWSQSSQWDNFWPSSGSSRGGQIASYSLATDEWRESIVAGYCLDYQLVDLQDDGHITYVFSCNSWRESHDQSGDYYDAFGGIYAFNDQFAESSRMQIGNCHPMGATESNYFRLFPNEGDESHQITGVGFRSEGFGTLPNVYWSDWPSEGPDIQIDSVGFGKVVDYESAEDGKRYAFLPRDQQVLVLSVDNPGVAGILEYAAEILDMRSVVSQRGVRDEIIVLSAGRIRLMNVGSLSIAASQITPTTLQLSSYPNPFNSFTTIGFSVPISGGRSGQPVSLRIYDLAGRLVADLSGHSQIQNPQSPFGKVVWNSGGLAAGCYSIRLEAAGQTQSRTILLLK